MAAPQDDPGWGVNWLTFVPGLLVPRFAFRRTRKAAGVDPLVQLRTIFLSFCAALVWIGIVVVLISSSGESSMSVSTAVLLVLALGGGAQVALRLIAKPLDCSTPTALAVSYRTRFFLRIAFSESAALVGFVGAFISANPLVYFVGVVIAAVGFAQAAPTAAHLGHDQDELSARGCPGSLVAALRQPFTRS